MDNNIFVGVDVVLKRNAIKQAYLVLSSMEASDERLFHSIEVDKIITIGETVILVSLQLFDATGYLISA